MNHRFACISFLVAAALGCDGVSSDPRRDDLHFRIADAEQASWDFGEAAVRVGLPPVAVTIVNEGVAASGALVIDLAGPDVGDFAVLDATSDCAGRRLEPAASCVVRVQFLPKRTGAVRAALRVASDAGEPHELMLLGAGRESALIADASVDIGLVEIGRTSTADVVVRNSAATPLTGLVAAADGDGVAVASTSCTGTLEPAGTCTVRVAVTTTRLGVATGTVRVTSGAEVSLTSVTATGAYRVTVVRAGSGSGVVTSNPAGMSCDATTCTGIFAGRVELTVVAATGDELTRWIDGPCRDTRAAPCAIEPSTAPVTVSAQIDPDVSKTITLRAVGDATGAIVSFSWGGSSRTCWTECTIEVPNDGPLWLRASTPSHFVGWSGDGVCTGTDTTCEGAVTRDMTIVATFRRHERERWTAVDARHEVLANARIAFAPNGGLVAWTRGTEGRSLVRYDAASGAELWRYDETFGGELLGLEINEAGRTFALYRESSILQLWCTNAEDGSGPTTTLQGGHGALALSPSGNAVVAGTIPPRDGGQPQIVVAAVDGACARTWERTVPGRDALAVAVAPDGVIHVVTVQAPSGPLLRFSATGEPLADLALPAGVEPVQHIAIGRDGRIVLASSRAVYAIRPSGERLFAWEADGGDQDSVAALRVAADGTVVRVSGDGIDLLDVDGRRRSRVERPWSAGVVSTHDAAVAPDGTVAVAGRFTEDQRAYFGFASVFEP
jgi:hypothetical protein